MLSFESTESEGKLYDNDYIFQNHDAPRETIFKRHREMNIHTEIMLFDASKGTEVGAPVLK